MGGFGQVKKYISSFLMENYGLKAFLKEDFCYQENGVIIENRRNLKRQNLDW